jgi:hypothetical protein
MAKEYPIVSQVEIRAISALGMDGVALGHKPKISFGLSGPIQRGSFTLLAWQCYAGAADVDK